MSAVLGYSLIPQSTGYLNFILNVHLFFFHIFELLLPLIDIALYFSTQTTQKIRNRFFIVLRRS